jgi:hypothetical protein
MMKSLKAAAVAAGSLIVAGVASPAMAHSALPEVSYNLDGVVNTTADHTRDAKGPLGTVSLGSIPTRRSTARARVRRSTR